MIRFCNLNLSGRFLCSCLIFSGFPKKISTGERTEAVVNRSIIQLGPIICKQTVCPDIQFQVFPIFTIKLINEARSKPEELRNWTGRAYKLKLFTRLTDKISPRALGNQNASYRRYNQYVSSSPD